MISLWARLRQWPLALPLGLCAVVNTAIFVAIGESHPAYLKDYRTNPSPDAPHYVRLGHNLFLHGAWSRSAQPPFVSDIFRTPGYPVFAGGLDLLGGPALVYAVQVLLHLVLCATVYFLTRRAFGSRAALFAALFTALHPTLLVLNFQTMSEIPFLCLLALSALLLLKARDAQAPGRLALVSGLLLGLATLVRPAGLYLPLVVAVFLGGMVARTRGFGPGLRQAAVFCGGVIACLAPWIARNQVVFGVPTLTTNDTVVLIYFTGAGAYQVHHGVDRETAQAMIAREFGIHAPEDMWNYHAHGCSAVEMDQEARRAIVPVLTHYPADLCVSCALGLVKAFFSHDAGFWAGILDVPAWNPPSGRGLLQLQGSAWARLTSNHPGLIVVFFAQLLTNLALVGLTLIGVVMALRRVEAASYLILLFLGFFALICAASGLDAYTRFSAPVLPFAASVAGLAASRLFGGRQQPLTPAVSS